jgi:molybdopterin-guanine dinucleotide biosynthesis protein B
MKPAVLQVVGYKKAGKTTLVSELLRMLSGEGLRIAALKRDDHACDPEPAGVDTRRFREAGAFLAGLASDARTMWVKEQSQALEDMIAEAASAGADLVLVEGFKSALYPKVVLLRDEADAGLLALSGIIAVAVRQSSIAVEQAVAAAGYPLFLLDRGRYAPLLAHVCQWLALQQSTETNRPQWRQMGNERQ